MRKEMWHREYLKQHGYITIVGPYCDEAGEYMRASKREIIAPTYEDECRLILETENIFDVAIYCY